MIRHVIRHPCSDSGHITAPYKLSFIIIIIIIIIITIIFIIIMIPIHI